MDNKQGDNQRGEPPVDKPNETTPPASAASSASGADSGKPSNRSPGASRRAKRGRDSVAGKAASTKPQADSAKGPGDKARASTGKAGADSAKGDTAKAQRASTTGKETATGRADQAGTAKDGAPTHSTESDERGTTSARGNGKSGSTRDGTSSPRSPSARAGKAWPWLVAAVILLFVLAGLGGWQFWQLEQARQAQTASAQADRDRLAERIKSLSGELADTRTSIQSLEQRDEAIRKEVESALGDRLDQLAKRQDHLGERVARIDDRLSRGEIAWRTAEVGFLITRAQERLSIARDPAGARLALELADERVAALASPHWLPLRSAISDAIASLEKASRGDRVGQALALRRLADRVEEWPLTGQVSQSDPDPSDAAGVDDPALAPDAPWYERLWATGAGWLTSQVSVTRSDRPARLRERVSTDREMRLWLTAVREALLSRDHEALVATLDQSLDWLRSQYAAEAPGPAKAIDALKTVRARFAQREFPSLDAVLRAWERASDHEKARAEESDKETPS